MNEPSLLEAAAALLAAFGGDTPKWLQPEAVALEQAIEREQARVPIDPETEAQQLEEWADQIERDGLVIARPAMIGIVAGMREVAADHRRGRA